MASCGNRQSCFRVSDKQTGLTAACCRIGGTLGFSTICNLRASILGNPIFLTYFISSARYLNRPVVTRSQQRCLAGLQGVSQSHDEDIWNVRHWMLSTPYNWPTQLWIQTFTCSHEWRGREQRKKHLENNFLGNISQDLNNPQSDVCRWRQALCFRGKN